jgi:hypothetical protein
MPQESYTAYDCAHNNFRYVFISTNTADVDFDASAVHFVVDGRIIDGEEREETETSWRSLDHAVYNLASGEVVARKQAYNPFREFRGPIPYPTFFFKFPIECREYENAVFVMDGFSRRGKRLPPLRVRLNYDTFMLVPAYVGPPPAKQ